MDPNQTNWQYKPGNEAPVSKLSPAPAPSAPAVGTSQTPEFSWTASEFVAHEKGVGWYGLLVIGGVALAALAFIVTKDWTAIIAIVAVTVIVAVFAARKPQAIKYELSSSGIRIGQKYYSYNLFHSFSLVREDSVSSITLLPSKRFMPPLSAHFAPEDEEHIVDTLGNHLPYEQKQLDGVERLTRRLRF